MKKVERSVLFLSIVIRMIYETEADILILRNNRTPISFFLLVSQQRSSIARIRCKIGGDRSGNKNARFDERREREKTGSKQEILCWLPFKLDSELITLKRIMPIGVIQWWEPMSSSLSMIIFQSFFFLLYHIYDLVIRSIELINS